MCRLTPCCFANWLRNHDELDLEGIGKKAMQTVLDAFAPEEEMYVYQRGIRRRLAPMLNGNQKAAGVLPRSFVFATWRTRDALRG
uniref:CAZy families GH13 protein n=1 Tax=uncultured Enterobacter sp. TaxID=238202 RepID=A0A060C7R2_9ENTR|nr:CAZy families GH13 protein [uncultured Enterobacter sp.]